MERHKSGISFPHIALAMLVAPAATLAAQESAAPSSPYGPLERAMDWLSRLGPRGWIHGLVLLAAILAGVVLGRIAAAVLRRIGSRVERTRFQVQAGLFEGAAGPVNLLLITLAARFGLTRIVVSEGVGVFVHDVIALLVYVALFWYAYNLVGVLEIALKRLVGMTATALDDMLVPMIRKTLRVFVITVGFLLVAENVFRQDIGAWLAGLGIAGLAVSLAAQDSLRNLLGSITILFDHPFRVGDRIVFAGYDGLVEEIGFRSIKIRTLAGHLVTVPNSKIVNEPVEDISLRPSIRRIMNVTITYDTTPDKVREAVAIVKRILEEEGIREPIHGRVGNDEFPPRVFFSDLNAASLNIFVIYWFFPAAYWDYMAHAERLNLRLLEEFERAGIEFAFPTQTLYLAGDPRRPLSQSPQPRP